MNLKGLICNLLAASAVAQDIVTTETTTEFSSLTRSASSTEASVSSIIEYPDSTSPEFTVESTSEPAWSSPTSTTATYASSATSGSTLNPEPTPSSSTSTTSTSITTTDTTTNLLTGTVKPSTSIRVPSTSFVLTSSTTSTLSTVTTSVFSSQTSTKKKTKTTKKKTSTKKKPKHTPTPEPSCKKPKKPACCRRLVVDEIVIIYCDEIYDDGINYIETHYEYCEVRHSEVGCCDKKGKCKPKK
ncbi:hypothetical protein JX265_008822 [Neoarthrinium moseri]|uniref:Uncharacterized protein n=1 Tax=Neoarthrinium moseri TaxID=1658444 RepID=A0A9P9WHC0_9PEZI|nr:hypothetical protein JX266_005702 [Neoarthrinium moseri]KAI1863605.1 hypothetical protein JX265_008822 [Neoarthrinium moseri]